MNYNSLEFKDILNKYESAKEQGKVCYLDSDDFVDIAEYYLANDDLNKMLEAVLDGLKLHDGDSYLLSLKVNSLISLHRFHEAEEVLRLLNVEEDHDVYYFKAQLACAQEGDDKAAFEYFRQWITIEQEECERTSNKNEGKNRLKDAYFHIIVSFSDLSTNPLSNNSIREWVNEYLRICSPLDGDEIDIEVAKVCHDCDLFEEEINVYSQCLDNNPYMPQGWTYLASLQHVTGKTEDSVNSAENAIAVDPNDIQALMVKGHGYYDLQNYAKALDAYLKYYEMTHDETFLMIIGRCYVMNKQNEEGYKFLIKARDYSTKKENKNKELQANNRAFISDSLYIGGFYKEALNLINVVLRTYPHEAEFLLQKGNILTALGNTDKAVETYYDAIECTESGKAAIMMLAGGELFAHGFYRAALFFLTMASKQTNDPLHYKSFAYLAQICYIMNLDNLFLQYSKLACEYTPDVLAKLWPADLKDVAPEHYYDIFNQMYEKKKKEQK